ncbi:MAG: circularly permuted type 2 ATP-grasp protein, partial [Acidobacteriota bacterium]
MARRPADHPQQRHHLQRVGDARGADRLWPLDPIPLILSENEWSWRDQAITQRARLLGGILRDANRPQQLPTTGKLPPELIFPNPHFLRPCLGIPVPGAVR